MKKFQKIAIFMMVTGFGLEAATPVTAPAPPSAAGKHDGVFINAVGGLGYGVFTETVGNQSASYTGLGFQYGAKLGFSLSDSVVLYGAVDGHSLSNPTATLTVGSASASVSTQNLTYSVLMWGAGIGFYTDSNFFVRTTLGVAKGTVSSGTASISTDAGIGVNLNIGQEWMVADKFGIGLAGIAHYSNVKDAGNTAHQFYFGLAASATFN